MIDRDRALALLGNGLGPTEVGTTLGCDPSYISQLLMDEEFKGKVLTLRMQNLQAATARDNKIDSLEDTVLAKLEEHLPYATKLRDVLGAFAIINNAKRRGARAAGNVDGLSGKVVAILLPVAARTAFVTNAKGEVVRVGEQVTETMPLQSLMKSRLAERKALAVDAVSSENPAAGGSKAAGAKA